MDGLLVGQRKTGFHFRSSPLAFFLFLGSTLKCMLHMGGMMATHDTQFVSRFSSLGEGIFRDVFYLKNV